MISKGYGCKAECTDGVVSAIQVNTINEDGTVISLSSDKTILTYCDQNGTPQVQKSAATTTVKFSDDTAAAFSDIQENDKITLTLDSNGIKNIRLSNRTSVSTGTENSGVFIQGTIVALDKDAKKLVLKQTGGQMVSYSYDTITQLFINGITNPTVDDIKVDMSAKIQLYDGKISYLNIDNRIQGSVYLVDAAGHVLTISLPNNELKSYTVNPSYTVTLYNQYTADLSDIHRNDIVRVNANEQNVVTNIDVQKTFIYQGTDVTESSKTIGVEDSNGKVITDQVNAVDNLYIYLVNGMQGYRYSTYVYTHQGVYNINVNSLQKNDSVTLYLLNDTVYEINKAN
jgi:ribosomal protein S11